MKNKPGAELRTVDFPVNIEKRGNQLISGYALKFNVLSQTIGWFRERIDRKALDNTDMKDVVALFNHNIDMVLARTTSKTLELEVDETGLKYTFTPPNTTAGRDLVESLKRGDVRHSSFSFSVEDDHWTKDDEGTEIRTITKIKRLYDVSPVVNPAYLQATSELAKRSYQQWKLKYDDLQDLEDDLELRKILMK